MKIFQRALHAVAVVVVTAMAAVVGFVVLMAWALVLIPDNRCYVEWVMITVAVVLVLLAAIGISKELRYRWLFSTGIILAGCLTWLSHDDPRGYTPQSSEPFATKDSKGFRVLVWMVPDVPGSRLKERNDAKPLANGLRLPPTNVQWAGYIAEHRDEIIAAWEGDKLGDEWVSALVGAEPCGLVSDQVKTSMLRFSVVREVFEIRYLFACVAFADGKSDEAAQIIGTSVCALSKLSRGGGTMVNEMISAVLLKRSYLTLNYLLDSTSFSLERRHQLLVALKEVLGGAEVCKLMFNAERFFAHETIPDKVTSELSQTLSSDLFLDGIHPLTRWAVGSAHIARFLINPRGAGRRYDQALQQISQAGQKRKMEEMGRLLARAKESRLDTFRLKDPLGRLFIVSSLPAFEKVVNSMWEIDDLRLDLIKRIEAVKP